MSIATTVRTAGPFAGTGSLVALPFAFKVFAASDLVVQRTNVAGDVATLTLTTHYSVSLNADQDTSPGGTVTLVTALASGETAMVTSNVAATQPLQLASGGPFLPGQIEDALDRAMIVVQQQGVLGGQALRVPLGETALSLPSADQRANKALLFDADGDPYLAAPASGSAADLALSIASTASGKGASLVAYQHIGRNATTVGKKLDAVAVSPIADFGAVGDGVADDTVALQNALSYAQSTGVQVNGDPGATYKITSKLRITAGNVYFDGQYCRFNNRISDAVAADPMIEISVTGSNNIALQNFRVIGLSTNGHTIALIGNGLSSSPEFVTLDNILVQGSGGNGKDYLGAAMPAQLFYAYGGMTIKARNCVSYQAGGLYFYQTLKVVAENCTIDSPLAGALMTVNQCNYVNILTTVFNGGNIDQLVATNFLSLVVRGNRFKGSNGGRHGAIVGASSGFIWEGNQHEVYATAANCLEVATSVVNPVIRSNVFSYINNGPTNFTGACIALIDHPGGGYIGYAPVIEANTLVINSSLTVAAFIKLASTLNSWRFPRILSNATQVAGAGGSNYTLTAAIQLAGNIRGAVVERNSIGTSAAGSVVTTGIDVGAGSLYASLLENNSLGSVTTFVADAGSKTSRLEGGVLVATSYTPVVSGATTAGAGTYTTQTASYTIENGRLKVDINVAWSAHTGTGQILISLPFAAANKIQLLTVSAENLLFAGQLCASVTPTGNVVKLWVAASNAALAAVAMDTAAQVYISGVLDL